MHAWGVVDLKVYLAQKNHGYSISAQSYECYLHLTQLDILEFTLSPRGLPSLTQNPSEAGKLTTLTPLQQGPGFPCES